VRIPLGDSSLIVPWQIVLPFWMFVGVVWIVLVSWGQPGWLKVSGAGLLIASAAGALGALIGFLFGMPKARQADTQPDSSNAGSGLLLSTHLQDVADWLTKLIVGAGLVQLGNLRGYFVSLGAYLSGESGLTKSESVTIVVYFIVVGFLLGYLWAELYLSTKVARLMKALDSSGSTGSEVAKEVTATEEQPVVTKPAPDAPLVPDPAKAAGAANP
jgi:hypothetical protein